MLRMSQRCSRSEFVLERSRRVAQDALSGERIPVRSALELWRLAMWMRLCAVCKEILRKPRLCDSVRCQCGWEW
jgi:hypothetical protein